MSNVDLEKIQDEKRYIRFRIGPDEYASRLMDVQEVIEYSPPKRIPNTNDDFVGVINVRGEIVGVIDLRSKLGYTDYNKDKGVLVVFNTEFGLMSCVVDSLIDVKEIESFDSEAFKKMKSRVPREYILGLFIDDDHFVTSIDLKMILQKEDVTSFETHLKIA